MKNCNFAQTTSSSYSTRNKYESYLLPKEIHDALYACVHGPASEAALASLSELCAYYFELLDAGTAKKNLVLPLQEMLAHSPEGLAAVVRFLERARSSESFEQAMNVMRCAVSVSVQDHAGRVLAENATVLGRLIEVASEMGRRESMEAMVALVLLSIAAPQLTDETAPAGFALVLAEAAKSELPHPLLGHQFLTRLAVRGPPWLLCQFDAFELVQRTDFHVQARRMAVAKHFFRLTAAVLRAYKATGSWPPSMAPSQPAWAEMTSLLLTIASETDALRASAMQCLAALVDVQPESRAAVVHQVGSLPPPSFVEDDDYENDERITIGFKRVNGLVDSVTTSTVALRLQKQQQQKLKQQLSEVSGARA